MKRVIFTKLLALALCALFFVSAIPTMEAKADSFYWAPLVVKATIYHGTDKLKDFETRQAGDKVQVLDRTFYRNSSGETFLRVSAFYNDSSQQQTGYMPSSSIPAGIPATSYLGTCTANNDTYLYTSTSTNGQTMTKIPAGMEIKVVQRFNDWYLAEVQDVFYGYVKSSFFSSLASSATPAAAAATPTAAAAAPSAGASTGTSGSVRTTVKLLNDKVVSTGSVASGTKLYKINTLNDTHAYAQIASKGSCKILYRVPNNFYMIEVNGLYAYVPTQSVVVNDSSAPMTTYAGTMETIVVSSTNTAIPTTTTAAATTKTGTIANCSSWVSMRKKASSSSSRLAKVKKGQTVTILGKDGDYTKVSYDGETGYILSSYIK